MAQNNTAKQKKEWRELYERIQGVLQQFGQDDCAGGDYFLVDDIVDPNTHLLEIHRLHMLRPEIITSLQHLLIEFRDWQIEVYVVSPEEKTIISPENGLILRSDGIIDALDRTLLPRKYQRLVYEGGRRPPKDSKQ